MRPLEYYPALFLVAFIAMSIIVSIAYKRHPDTGQQVALDLMIAFGFSVQICNLYILCARLIQIRTHI